MKISRQARELFNTIMGGFIGFLAKHNVNPNTLTFLGFLLTLASVYFYITSSLLYAGLFLTLGALLDGVDGAVARRVGKSSKAGAFIDSTIDRVGDSAIAIGILLTNLVEPLYVILMLALSMLVSYTKARAEGLGVEMQNVGIAERWVRLVIIITSTFLGVLSPAFLEMGIIVVIILSSITVIQRSAYSITILKRK